MNLNVIKQELLIARSEAEDEIAQIDRLLQIFGQSNGGEQKRVAKIDHDKKRPPNSKLLQEVENTLRGARRPLRSKEIYEHLKRNSRTVGRALTYLKKEGKIDYTRDEENRIFWSLT